MPHIELEEGLPGILGPMSFRPATAKPLNALADVLLRGESTLSRGERELIAAFVSSRNECTFCCDSHSAFARHQLDGGEAIVESVKRDYKTAAVSAKLKTLLAIAGLVQKSGRAVTSEAVAAARAAGATDTEIHDTVLIAAAFCMFNRYVDGLATLPPADPAAYEVMAQRVVKNGYGTALPHRS